MSGRQRIIKRLKSYWKLEAGNAFLIPAMMFWFTGGNLGLVSYVAMAPMILLLLIGAAYWHAKWLQLTDASFDIVPHLTIFRRLRTPALVLTITALGWTIYAWLNTSISVGFADRVVASIASGLALAEYVNYYHRQLQHFDNVADFKRLLRGKGFRRSQMAIDLEEVGADQTGKS
ncbi:hypothetical protein [Parasphingorhabdus halotolerans]|uniref:Uncharacterized protein n=1 Tax=Parasphingorhabdus halotolerans TaxID=2725558 RepID=A0A6H2DMG8_9SPHN|nr:hypothetical protein [Parasphingorhabdus halotolerans]QJB69183.1 hypothetical protein HF685_07750 [Parasphingorhabdus halotolerans]